MRAILMGVTAAAVLVAGSAIAADIPRKAAPPPPVPVQTWTGFYVGLQLGYLWGDADHTFSNGAPSDTSSFDGLIGGVHAGYNFQAGNIVFGIEADVEASGADGGFNNFTGITSQGSAALSWQGSVRGRLGVTSGPALFYATGGWAYSEFRFGGGPVLSGPCCRYTDNLSGWTVGGGVEWMFSASVTGRIEYRYTDFGSASGALVPDFPGVTMPVDVTTQAIRAGVSVKFN